MPARWPELGGLRGSALANTQSSGAQKRDRWRHRHSEGVPEQGSSAHVARRATRNLSQQSQPPDAAAREREQSRLTLVGPSNVAVMTESSYKKRPDKVRNTGSNDSRSVHPKGSVLQQSCNTKRFVAISDSGLGAEKKPVSEKQKIKDPPRTTEIGQRRRSPTPLTVRIAKTVTR